MQNGRVAIAAAATQFLGFGVIFLDAKDCNLAEGRPSLQGLLWLVQALHLDGSVLGRFVDHSDSGGSAAAYLCPRWFRV